jgi:hypothetical protein
MEYNQVLVSYLETQTPGSLMVSVGQPKDQTKDPNASVTGGVAVTVPGPGLDCRQYDCKRVRFVMGPVFSQGAGGKQFPLKDAYRIAAVSDVEEWTQAEKVAFYQKQLAGLQAVPQVGGKK